ncbi:MAG: response regulator [Algibacter sp.]
MLLSFFKNIASLGVDSKHTNQKNKTIRLINIICMLWYFAFTLVGSMIVSGLISYTEEKFYKGISVNIIGLVLTAVIQYLNKIKKSTLAALGMLFFTAVYFFIVTTYSAPQKFIEFFYILVPIISLVVLDKYIYSWFLLGISIILFHYTFVNLGFYQYNGVLFISPLMIWLFVINFLIVLYFKKLNHNNEKLLELERDKVLSDKIILEKQEAKLRELNEFKSHFFVNLSHEIRTPLTLIQGYANQIDLKASEEINTGKLDIVKAQCKQMQDIINNIMDLSKIESSELQLTSTYINLHPFLEKHFANFQGLFIKKNISFRLNNEVKNTTILIDENLFSKAVNNLLSNALKFTSTGGSVSININSIDNKLIIEIEDNGIGIPEDELEFIFKRFYQVKNDITKSQGSGIGLAFTKSIVDAHHFSIQLKSIYGEGTCFSVLIPTGYTKHTKPNSSSLNEQESTLSNSTQTIDSLLPQKEISKGMQKILLVDDHEPMRLYLKEVLKKYSITQAENGKEALDILKKDNNFDLIITDYMMPVMDGEEFVKQLKQNLYKIPIIVLTARTDNSGKLSMLRLGIDGYLYKPFMEEELLINVSNSLKLYENVKDFDMNNSSSEVKALNIHIDKFNAKITTYINQNITSHLLTVDTIADYMNVSRSTLNRKTKSLLGQTVNQLIIEVRLAKARTLKLEKPLASKKEIAEAVGASNTTHLFNCLKERYGI